MTHPTGHENRLAQESSPYLLLHKDNPVDWYPWGAEAIERARREDKPIFLSVGYSTCYWCHVMERESFSDPAVAELMNRSFVNVKVDREERPDLDEIYMTATQVLTGQGGWPNSVFLTPDLKPFYAGTYFPPDDRYGRPGFPSVLRGIAEAWADRRQDVLKQVDEVTAHMRRALEQRSAPGDRPPRAVGGRRRLRRAALPLRPQVGRLRRGAEVPHPVESLPAAGAGADRAEGRRDAPRHPRPHGPGRHLRPAGRRLPPLLDRRRVEGAPLREDALRQRPAAGGLRPGVRPHAATPRWRGSRARRRSSCGGR